MDKRSKEPAYLCWMWKLVVDNSSNTRNIKTPCRNICSNKYAIIIFAKAVHGLALNKAGNNKMMGVNKMQYSKFQETKPMPNKRDKVD